MYAHSVAVRPDTDGWRRLCTRNSEINSSGKIDLFAWSWSLVSFFFILYIHIHIYPYPSIYIYIYIHTINSATECWRWETISRHYSPTIILFHLPYFALFFFVSFLSSFDWDGGNNVLHVYFQLIQRNDHTRNSFDLIKTFFSFVRFVSYACAMYLCVENVLYFL